MYTLKNGQQFPDTFRAKFNYFAQNFDIEFQQTLKKLKNIFVSSNGQEINYNFNQEDLYEKYEQKYGNGFAILTRSKIFNNQFRLVCSNIFH